MKKAAIIIFFLLIAGLSFSQQIPRFNPDTIRSTVIDSTVVDIRSNRLNVQDFNNSILRNPVI